MATVQVWLNLNDQINYRLALKERVWRDFGLLLQLATDCLVYFTSYGSKFTRRRELLHLKRVTNFEWAWALVEMAFVGLGLTFSSHYLG